MTRIELEKSIVSVSVKNISETVLKLSPLVFVSLALAAVLNILYLKENILALLETTVFIYFLEVFSLGVILEKNDYLARFAFEEIANIPQRECLCAFFLSILPVILIPVLDIIG